MANGDLLKLLSGDIFEEDVELSLADLCRACQLPAENVFELVEQGVIEPIGRDPAGWRFRGISVRRVRCARRLEQDLGVNVAGAALAIDLLEELQRLRTRLRRLEG
jgi:chaperone modulatory protein CbpM